MICVSFLFVKKILGSLHMAWKSQNTVQMYGVPRSAEGPASDRLDRTPPAPGLGAPLNRRPLPSGSSPARASGSRRAARGRLLEAPSCLVAPPGTAVAAQSTLHGQGVGHTKHLPLEAVNFSSRRICEVK